MNLWNKTREKGQIEEQKKQHKWQAIEAPTGALSKQFQVRASRS